MSYLIVFALTAGAYAAFRLNHSKSTATGPSSHSTSDSVADSQFACVELRCGRGSCRAARRIRRVSQLASEAPVLPLPGCDKGICNCSYQKTDDRRQSEGRRLVDLGIQPLIFDGNEQRDHISDRRI